MKSLSISVVSRETSGRHAANRLRAQGVIPAVVYGKSGTFSLGVKEKDFRLLLKAKGSGAAVVEIEDECRKKTLATIAQVQKDAITDAFMHIDFKEITQDEVATFSIPVVISGEAVGVKTEGGTLEVLRHEVSVRCLLHNVVDGIKVDISDLHVGDLIHVKNLPPLKGIEYLGDPDIVVVSCSKLGTSEEDSKAAAPATPTA